MGGPVVVHREPDPRRPRVGAGPALAVAAAGCLAAVVLDRLAAAEGWAYAARWGAAGVALGALLMWLADRVVGRDGR
jgi:hypothetical protein